MNYYVYILKCNDGSFYTGVTNNIEKRIDEHQSGADNKCYTYKRRPLELVFVDSFGEINNAIEREKQIKGWSKKKKQALIDNNWDLLISLAKSKNGSLISHGSINSP